MYIFGHPVMTLTSAQVSGVAGLMLGLVNWTGADTAAVARLVITSNLERRLPRLDMGSL